MTQLAARLGLAFGGVCAAGLAGFCASHYAPPSYFVGSANRATQIQQATVQVFSDRFSPADGLPLRLESGGVEHVLVTDSEGQTPWVPVDASSALTLTLVETPQRDGILVGMIETLHAPTLPNDQNGLYFAEVARTQPLAVPVFIRQEQRGISTDIRADDGSYDHWCILLEADSQLRLRVNVASLLDSGAVHEYLRYRGDLARVNTNYVRGVTLIVPHVRIGSPGFVVGIDLLGDLANGVIVDAMNYTASPGSATFQTQLLGVVQGKVLIKITGELQAGHLALLARAPDAANPGVSQVVLDAPPLITVPPHGGQGVDSVLRDDEGSPSDEDVARAGGRPGRGVGAGAAKMPASSSPLTRVTNCEPPVPNMPPDWTCDITNPPVSLASCPATTPGVKECKQVRMRGHRICRVGGSVCGLTRGKTVRFKLSFAMAANGTLSSGGGIEYGEEETTVLVEQWTADNGDHGLGECMRWFRFHLVCAQWFLQHYPSLRLTEDLVFAGDCDSAWKKRICTDVDESQTDCSRTP